MTPSLSEGPVRRSRARVPLAIAVGLVLLSACERVSPTEPAGPPEAELPEVLAPTALAAAECAVDLRSAVLACGPPEAAAADGGSVIVGRQGEDVAFASADASVEDDIFSVDVTVQNLIGQAIGTQDGVEPAEEGIRVFFSTEPWTVVGSGTVNIADADGTGDFTDVDQEYHQYNELLEPEAVSEPKTWEFQFDDVEVFRFRVMLWAPVQFPDGWVEVTPDDEVVNPDGTLELTADVFDVFGDPVEADLTWSSTNEDVATVEDGVVSGHERGTATIEVESVDGAPGAASIEVVPGIHTLVDAFAGTELDTDLWADSTVGQAQVVQNDRLELVLDQDAHSSAMVRSADYFDFREGSTFAEFAQFADGNGEASPLVETTFLVGTRDLVRYVAISAVRWPSGEMELTAWEQWSDGDFQELCPRQVLNTDAPRFQRLREEGGTVYFELSEDGTNWNPGWNTEHEFDDPARLHLWLAAAAPSEARDTTFEAPESTEPAHVQGVGTTGSASELQAFLPGESFPSERASDLTGGVRAGGVPFPRTNAPHFEAGEPAASHICPPAAESVEGTR